MKNFVYWVLAILPLAPALSHAQMFYDASQFGKSDICLNIQAAIAALPTSPANAGVVIDARNFKPTTVSPATLPCTVNPFTLAPNTNPLVLVNMGSTTTTPGSLGGVLLLPGYTISTDVPWIVPSNWSVTGEGGRVSVLAPSATFGGWPSLSIYSGCGCPALVASFATGREILTPSASRQNV